MDLALLNLLLLNQTLQLTLLLLQLTVLARKVAVERLGMLIGLVRLGLGRLIQLIVFGNLVQVARKYIPCRDTTTTVQEYGKSHQRPTGSEKERTRSHK